MLEWSGGILKALLSSLDRENYLVPQLKMKQRGRWVCLLLCWPTLLQCLHASVLKRTVIVVVYRTLYVCKFATLWNCLRCTLSNTEDKCLIRIVLMKTNRQAGNCWTSLLEGQYCADAWVQDQMQRKLTLERFQREVRSSCNFEIILAEITASFFSEILLA